MFQKFKKRPFKDRLKDTGFLIKNSFTIVRRDKDIKTPTIHMIILSSVITTITFISLLLLFTKTSVILGALILILTLFTLVPYKFFYNVRQKADQSWIVYNTLTGKDISYDDSHKHTKNEKGKLRLIALVDLIMSFAKNERDQSSGIMNILTNLLFAALIEIWDLLSHFMIPAVVIEQKHLKDIVPEIKSLKNNVPATLVGVFGIDFAGDVIKSILIPVYIIFILISVGIGYLISLYTKSTVISVFGISFSWVPVLIMMYIIFLIGGALKKIIESIKVIYFTIFYTSITRPMEIIPELKEELTNYLLMKKSDFEKPKELSPREQYLIKLSEYIKNYEASGHSEQEIVQFLTSKGYSQKDINDAIRNIKAK